MLNYPRHLANTCTIGRHVHCLGIVQKLIKRYVLFIKQCIPFTVYKTHNYMSATITGDTGNFKLITAMHADITII